MSLARERHLASNATRRRWFERRSVPCTLIGTPHATQAAACSMPSRCGDDLRGHIEIGIGRRCADPIFQLGPDDSYFSVDGLVSGIKSHMIEAPSKATAA